MHTRVTDLPYAHGQPPGQGRIKSLPEDFVVEEILSFEPSASGEHVLLFIEKRGENTEHIARQLGRFAGVSLRDIGYAGLKDRHGVTRQWFSVKYPVKTEADFSPLESASLKIVSQTRNTRKIRKGAIAGNRFVVRIRQLTGDKAALEERLAVIAQQGVPNYFGSQRFGHDGGNIAQSQALFAGELDGIDPHKRGLYLSAARSELFNRVLAARVLAGTWNQALEGDVYMFPDSHSYFTAVLDDDITRRVTELNIHPSGPLWGIGENPVSGTVKVLEETVLAEARDICKGLEQYGLETARRPLRFRPETLEWRFIEPADLEVGFILPSGAYATTLLRELVTHDE